MKEITSLDSSNICTVRVELTIRQRERLQCVINYVHHLRSYSSD